MSNIIKSNPQRLNEILQAPSVQAQFDQALGDAKGTFISSILSLYTSDTKLTKCDPNDVVVEALKAAALKLPLDKNLGLAYVIPYNKKVGGDWVSKPEFQLGYKGLMQLALRSGVYKTFNEGIVYEGMLKKHDRLTGEIDITGERISDKKIGYFAYIETKNGFQKCEYMTTKEVEDHAMKYSKTYSFNNSTWKTDFDKMAKKTVIKKLLSLYGQLSIELQMALGSEDDIIKNDLEARGDKPTIIDIPDNVDVETGEIVDAEDAGIDQPKNESPY